MRQRPIDGTKEFLTICEMMNEVWCKCTQFPEGMELLKQGFAHCSKDNLFAEDPHALCEVHNHYLASKEMVKVQIDSLPVAWNVLPFILKAGKHQLSVKHLMEQNDCSHCRAKELLAANPFLLYKIDSDYEIHIAMDDDIRTYRMDAFIEDPLKALERVKIVPSKSFKACIGVANRPFSAFGSAVFDMTLSDDRKLFRESLNEGFLMGDQYKPLFVMILDDEESMEMVYWLLKYYE